MVDNSAEISSLNGLFAKDYFKEFGTQTEKLMQGAKYLYSKYKSTYDTVLDNLIESGDYSRSNLSEIHAELFLEVEMAAKNGNLSMPDVGYYGASYASNALFDVMFAEKLGLISEEQMKQMMDFHQNICVEVYSELRFRREISQEPSDFNEMDKMHVIYKIIKDMKRDGKKTGDHRFDSLIYGDLQEHNPQEQIKIARQALSTIYYGQTVENIVDINRQTLLESARLEEENKLNRLDWQTYDSQGMQDALDTGFGDWVYKTIIALEKEQGTKFERNEMKLELVIGRNGVDICAVELVVKFFNPTIRREDERHMLLFNNNKPVQIAGVRDFSPSLIKGFVETVINDETKRKTKYN